MSCIVAYWLQSLKRSLEYLISVLHSPRRFFSKHFTRLPPPPVTLLPSYQESLAYQVFCFVIVTRTVSHLQEKIFVNRFVIVCNIQIVIRMLKIQITVLQVCIRGLISGKIGSRLQKALFFLFHRNFQPRLCSNCSPILPIYHQHLKNWC